MVIRFTLAQRLFNLSTSVCHSREGGNLPWVDPRLRGDDSEPVNIIVNWSTLMNRVLFILATARMTDNQ